MNSISTPRLLTLAAWAETICGEHAPCITTLRRWAREGRITPQPVKYGKLYFVERHAKYQGD
jgi:predicted site-specific integrase-resolvase